MSAPTPVTAYLALGSNVGDRAAYLAHARAAVDALPDTRLVGASAIEETAPVGPVAQGPFLNQMLRVVTTLSPESLLDAAHAIERAAGRDRTREVRWGPRTLDVDLVLFGDAVVESARLTVPHPALPDRDFWQRELAELGVTLEAAGARHAESRP